VTTPSPATLLSVNVGRLRPNPNPKRRPTGIDKRPDSGQVEVRAPGARSTGLGSGLVGDQIGDRRHHGGDGQAVYAVAREELNDWGMRLGRVLANGAFGENLTTSGLPVSDAVLGERWQVGETVILQVTGPRIPCGTFRAHMGEKGWLKSFTQEARSGAYLSVVVPGTIRAGDSIRVLRQPDHGVTARLAFRALTLEPELLPSLLTAGDDLPPELHDMAAAHPRSASAQLR
jgi:MOSC domain-containing protein YiiM